MEKPIIFSTPMVRAILEGRKTQTRRVVKSPFEIHANGFITKPDKHDRFNLVVLPYKPGDILWVRETWQYKNYGDYGYTPDDFIYKADPNETWVGPWRPAIHMPYEASRIHLKIKNVRVERLQDITEEDAIAEGIKEYMEFNGVVKYWIDDLSLGVGDMPRSAKKAFEIIWNSIYAKRGYGWDINPWVWVIEFERS